MSNEKRIAQLTYESNLYSTMLYKSGLKHLPTYWGKITPFNDDVRQKMHQDYCLLLARECNRASYDLMLVRQGTIK